MNILKKLSSESTPLVVFCFGSLGACFIAVHTLGLSFLLGLMLCFSIFGVSLTLASHSLKDLEEKNKKALEHVRVLEFSLGVLCGITFLYSLIAFGIFPELDAYFKARGIS